MNEKGVLNDIAPASFTLPPGAVKEPLSIILDEVKSFCMDYHVDFWDLLGALENSAGDSLEGKINFSLTDLSYNVRNKRIMDDPSHDIFPHEDMRKFVDFVQLIKYSGAHRHISGS